MSETSTATRPFAAFVSGPEGDMFQRVATGTLPFTISAAECGHDPQEACSIVSAVLRENAPAHAVVKGIMFHDVLFGAPAVGKVNEDPAGCCQSVVVHVPASVILVTDADSVGGSAGEADILFDELIADSDRTFLVSIPSLPYFPAKWSP